MVNSNIPDPRNLIPDEDKKVLLLLIGGLIRKAQIQKVTAGLSLFGMKRIISQKGLKLSVVVRFHRSGEVTNYAF